MMTTATLDTERTRAEAAHGRAGGAVTLCPVHNVTMTRYEKAGRAWYSHKTASGWCDGTQPIDTDKLKERVDLCDLAGRYTTLAKWAARELAGPCPRGACTAKTDGFHVHADGWFLCYTCHPEPGDVIEFLQWLGLARDFKGACEYLAGPTGLAQLPTPAHRVTPSAKQADWQNEDWQREARAILTRAQACLASDAGDAGADYLLRRGILIPTWEAWGIGFDPAKYDPATERKRPAIVLPWQRERITALKYRFTDSTGKGDRFTQKGGGQQIAFGLHVAGEHFSTLWLVEGELNALSLWQALRAEHCVNFDVVSFGGDSKAAHLDPVVKGWAARYLQVIVWADDQAKAAAAMSAIPGAFGLRSPVVNGQKLDANALVCERGALAEFALTAWDQFDSDPAFVARARAALELAA